MSRLLVTFDVEELDWGPLLAADRDPTSPSAEGLDRILPVLERFGIKATFFCTSVFARRQPQRVRSIARSGHELASHGWEHGDDYGRLAPALSRDRLRDSRRLLEDVSCQEVRGVRTPRLSNCGAGTLLDAGFVYDASSHPTWVKTGREGLRMSRSPWMEAGLTRIPLSVVPVVRLPVAWYVFRAVGPASTYALARLAGLGTPCIHLYFHPWEAADLGPGLTVRPLGWRTGSGWIRRFASLLEHLTKGSTAETVGDFVVGWRAQSAVGLPLPGTARQAS